ncbi:hypothetical protein Tco_0530132 [Tanacetum coccineum]
MSNSNTNLQTQSSNALHNAIMEAGSKDRPPMLAPGNYVQWKSRIKRYIDTKPNSELIHYCLQNPPYTYQWAEKTVPVAEGSSETTIERYMENYKNVSQDIRDQMNAEAEAVQIILTGIDNDIYSTVDACPNACEMWKAIERLKQGESINVQDLETNLYWEFGKFTSRDGESLESYYSRFYKMMNELVRNQCNVTNHQVNVQFLLQLQPEWQRFVTLVKQSQELKTVSYHKLYDILKQHQNEVNEIRTERLARTANPLALVAQQQPVYHPPNHPTQNTQYSSTRSQQSTRNRGKAIVTSSAPTYDPEPATVTEDDEMSKEKEIDKLMALISLSFKKIYKPTNNNLRTSSNTSRANQDNSPRINRGKHVIKDSMKEGNSSKEHAKICSMDMVHNHYLDEARKKTQEKDRNSKTSMMHFARFQSTADGSKPEPRWIPTGKYSDLLHKAKMLTREYPHDWYMQSGELRSEGTKSFDELVILEHNGGSLLQPPITKTGARHGGCTKALVEIVHKQESEGSAYRYYTTHIGEILRRDRAYTVAIIGGRDTINILAAQILSIGLERGHSIGNAMVGACVSEGREVYTYYASLEGEVRVETITNAVGVSTGGY